jgi:multidrug efflux pump
MTETAHPIFIAPLGEARDEAVRKRDCQPVSAPTPPQLGRPWPRYSSAPPGRLPLDQANRSISRRLRNARQTDSKRLSKHLQSGRAERIVADINRTFAPLPEGKTSAVQPPPIDNLGNTSGFSFRLQDRGQRSYADLMRARDQLLAAAARSPILQDVYVEGLAPAPQIELVIDREKASALGVTFEEINNAISTSLGSAYINDFPNRGRMQRVIVQADRNARMQPDQILTYNVRNSSGQLVPMSSFATAQWSVGPSQIVGFNYYPSVRFSGSAKPRYTSGDAIREMERLAARLPRGFGFEWAGQSLQEKLAGSQAPLLLMLSVPLVFLVLAALYESWTIPLSVLLTVPLGILGAVTAAMLRGLPNDVYFTVGIVTIIGLAAKDGILIIEFAKALRQQGLPIKEATITACRMRFRPIVMTAWPLSSVSRR